ncbi:hypothetical protein PTTG_26769 [Puccinia triticina 1-1 BBBD Race 1]|uniref:Uncharacterized protein n=2 Tax=Puccinia triticina TaxID=208348 RepID=A0A180GS88_PUCT1|nr:uncharacterized protein PtA15_6A61 [Puccinia triticina]OAV95142.1 hypothetical protein PTTG_26769 [Puccinia triticina 1-1 BBBD Race 1]WAQ85433.1 hypothetical protein PtA15_6A61 [Puccinia triticina]
MDLLDGRPACGYVLAIKKRLHSLVWHDPFFGGPNNQPAPDANTSVHGAPTTPSAWASYKAVSRGAHTQSKEAIVPFGIAGGPGDGVVNRSRAAPNIQHSTFSQPVFCSSLDEAACLPITRYVASAPRCAHQLGTQVPTWSANASSAMLITSLRIALTIPPIHSGPSSFRKSSFRTGYLFVQSSLDCFIIIKNLNCVQVGKMAIKISMVLFLWFITSRTGSAVPIPDRLSLPNIRREIPISPHLFPRLAVLVVLMLTKPCRTFCVDCPDATNMIIN